MISMLQAAEVASAPSKGQSILMNLLPFVLIFVVFYFLLIRPQKKKQTEHQKVLASLKASDVVLLNSGMSGKITQVLDDTKVKVEIASGVEVEVYKSYIVSLIQK